MASWGVKRAVLVEKNKPDFRLQRKVMTLKMRF